MYTSFDAVFTVAEKPSLPDPEGTKLFSCSTQLSIKFQPLIKTKTLKKIGISCF